MQNERFGRIFFFFFLERGSCISRGQKQRKQFHFRPTMAENDLLSKLVVRLSYIAFKGGIVMTEIVTNGMVKFDIHTNF